MLETYCLERAKGVKQTSQSLARKEFLFKATVFVPSIYRQPDIAMTSGTGLATRVRARTHTGNHTVVAVVNVVKMMKALYDKA